MILLREADMNILILGNGFDLAHGLPTRYTDFLEYCRAYNSEDCDTLPEIEAENIEGIA